MASSFKNAGMTVATTDNSSANVYTASTNGGAVIHAVYISNMCCICVVNAVYIMYMLYNL